MQTRPFIHTAQRLGEVVAAARREAKITQAQLADEAGVGRRFIVDVEAGHDRAELGKVLAVLDALGLQPRAVSVRPAWVYGEDGRLKPEYADE